MTPRFTGENWSGEPSTRAPLLLVSQRALDDIVVMRNNQGQWTVDNNLDFRNTARTAIFGFVGLSVKASNFTIKQ